MSFGVWFRQWMFAFLHLFSYDRIKKKSKRQREKERLRRLEAKHSSANKYRMKQKRRKKRSSSAVQNERLFGAMFRFVGATLAIFLLPFGLFDWGRKSVRAKRGTKHKKQSTSAAKSAAAVKPKATTSPKSVKTYHTAGTPRSQSRSYAPPRETQGASRQAKPTSLFNDLNALPKSAEPQRSMPKPENEPRSSPKNHADRYIHKRMIIAGSDYCDSEVLNSLTVGSCFDLALEPDNPYDKDAVMLIFSGRKIGYVARADRLAFTTQLRLGRKIYGVITDIDTTSNPPKYEFESWFYSTK